MVPASGSGERRHALEEMDRAYAGHPDTYDDPDTEAVRHLHHVHRPVLLSYLTRLTKGDGQWAEDIVQETFIRAWKNPQARDANGRWSQAWLFTVGRRITIDHIRAAQARPREYFDDQIDAHAGRDDGIEQMLDGQVVRTALNDLPERLRRVLIELYLQDRSVAETAEILDVPTGTVRSRCFYALRALRESLAEKGFLPDRTPQD
ncbi:sigma-70 family RNA polymerase sigma factor [Actinoplanes sp. NPDC049265]|uniref:sigma-70 family RNA polymerase sigma factor n=1 Tax=Actinoplanes sp. NPDC049265 TaxID=3363902 RepID=UPI0037144280